MTQRPVPVERRGLGRAWWVTVVVTALVLLASVLYAMGVPWVRIGLDGFWRFFDESIERLRALGALIPLVIAFVAYKVYRSEQWWKRAEWALDAASDDRPEIRRAFGNRTIDELLVSRMAPTQDFTMFSTVVADRLGGIVQDEIEGDPTVAARTAAPGTDQPADSALVDGAEQEEDNDRTNR